jgi:hypothetical protein
MFKNLLKKIRIHLAINIERHPNKNARTYHLTSMSSKFSESSIQHFSFPFRPSEYTEEISKVGEKGALLLRNLFQIPGVRTIWIKKYMITIHKKESSSWEDIQPKILDLLSNYKSQV